METAQFEQDQSGVIKLFVEKIKAQASPAAAADVVQEAIGNESLYVFGELLDLPVVAAMAADGSLGQTYKLLELFAYGKLADLKTTAGLPALTPAQAAKLKLLTIVSLAQESKLISYRTLQAELEIAEVRELEDTVIECIYQGLMVGKLDPKKQLVEVASIVGRDVRNEDIGSMLAKLTAWGGASVEVIQAIQQKTEMAVGAAATEKQRKADLALQIEGVKTALQLQQESEQTAVAAAAGGQGGGGRGRDYRQ